MPFLDRILGLDPSLGLVSGDDSLGYDFRLTDDESKVFVEAHDSNKMGKVRECYIQVKGFGGEWKNSFFVSKTELDRCRRCKEINARYIFVFVKNCDLQQRIQPEICGFYDW